MGCYRNLRRLDEQIGSSIIKLKIMRAYVIRRLLLTIPTLFIVSIIVFMLIRIIPGDIVDAMVAQLRPTGRRSESASV